MLTWSIPSGTRHLQEFADAGLELPAVNQVELHPFCQQREIAKWCTDHGVVVEVGSPLANFIRCIGLGEYPLISFPGRHTVLFFAEGAGMTPLYRD